MPNTKTYFTDNNQYSQDIENLKINPLTPEKMKIASGNLCDREWDNIKYTENLPDWLKGRFETSCS